MPDDWPEDYVRRLWRNQPEEEGPMSVDEIRRRARKFEKTIRRRNFREYAAAVVVVIAFGVSAWRDTNMFVRAGAGLTIAATVFIVSYLHRKGSAHAMPADLTLPDYLVFHRAELVRQRDLLQGVWVWYLLPFVPGMVLVVVGRTLDNPATWPRALVASAVCALVFFGIGRLNQWAARKVQRTIDALDAAR